MTFGPGRRREGILKHIEKEIEEVRSGDGDPEEWVDIVILGLDGLTRELASRDKGQLVARVAQRAAAMIQAKQSKNEARTWPDWRTMSEDQAIEHDRSKD
jgi:hypothetical protein